MSRIRSAHPGLFSDENFMVLTVEAPLAAVLLIGIWTEADDEGVFEWKPLTLKARILPAISASIDPLMAALVDNRFLMRFEVDGRSYGAVRNFTRWQRPKKPKAIHPKPELVRKYVGLTDATVGNEFGTGGELNADDAGPVPTSGEPVGNKFGTGGEIPPQMEDGGWRREERKEVRQDGNAVPRPEVDSEVGAEPPSPARAAKPKKRATRIDPAWKPDDTDRAFAVSVGIPAADIARHGAEFVDYWAGVGSEKGAKLDWSATWRNRCRQIAERKGYHPPPGSVGPSSVGGPPARPLGWPSGFPDPESLFEIWMAGKWSMTAWGFPPGDASCQLPRTITDEWQKRRAEAA